MHVSYFRFFVVALALLSLSAHAAAPAARAQRWALIASDDLRQSGRVDVVQAKLSGMGGIQWVEREQLRAAADELQVSRVLGADGVGERLKLGKLLRADALVVVATEARDAEPSKRLLRIVVIDANLGARLIDQRAADSGDAEAMAGVVAQVVEQARARFADGVQFVVAVPDFVSRDFVHDFDHHQSGFANLLGGALMSLPGVAVLEIDEAQAVSRELAGEPVGRRIVPLFVRGEYTVQAPPPPPPHASSPTSPASSQPTEPTGPTEPTEPTGPREPKVDFDIRISSGAGEVRKIVRRDVPLGAVAPFLAVEVPAALANNAPLKTRQPLSLEQQHAALIERASAFAELGFWERAVALRESALLLAPGDGAQRIAAVDEYTRLVKAQIPESQRETLRDPAAAERYVARRAGMWRRSLEHLEFLIRSRQIKLEPLCRMLFDLTVAVDRFPSFASGSPPPAYLREMQRDARDFLRHVTPLARDLPRENQYKQPAGTLYAQRLFVQEILRLAMARIDASERQKPPFPQRAADTLLVADLIEGPLADVRVGSFQMTYFMQHLIDDPRGQPAAAAAPLGDEGRASPSAKEVEALVDRMCNSPSRYAQLYGRYGRLYLQWRQGNASGDEQWQASAATLRADVLAFFAPRYDESFVSQIDWLISTVTGRATSRPARARAVASTSPASARAVVPARAMSEPTPVPADAPAVRFEPIAFNPAPASVESLTACGETLDVLMTKQGILFHREKGRLETAIDDAEAEFSSVAWDGRHVWVGSRRKGVVVLDASGAVVARFAEGDGLPPADRTMQLVAIAPGRVLAVGCHGEMCRAWCATIDLDASKATEASKATGAAAGGATRRAAASRVNVFHRATRVVKEIDSQAAKEIDLAFSPKYLTPLTKADGRVTQILVGRVPAAEQGSRLMAWPLLIEPAEGRVSAVYCSFLAAPQSPHVILEDGRVLVCLNNAVALLPSAMAERATTQLKILFKTGIPLARQCLLRYGGSIYYPGDNWCRIDAKTLATTPLRAEFAAPQRPLSLPLAGAPAEPPVQNMWSRYAVSAHFGIVTWMPGKDARFHRAIVPGE